MSGRLLITGGAGFIGSHIADLALRDGWTVAALDDLSNGRRENLPADVQLYEVDVRDAPGVSEVFADFDPSVVSHQAAQASVSVSVRDPVLDAEINIRGGLNVLEAARTHGVHRLVFASTGGAIYGEVANGMADETAPERPLSPYAISKLAFEQYMAAYTRLWQLSCVSLRYANVYGPRQNPHGEAGVVAVFCQRLLSGEALTINGRVQAGDDGCVRDYTYVEDVARANLAAFQENAPIMMNVASGVGTTTTELATLLATVMDRHSEVTFAPPRAGDIQRSVLDAPLYRELLGQPTALAVGLQKTAEWFSSKSQS